MFLNIHRDIKITSEEVNEELNKKTPKEITVLIYLNNLCYF